MKQSKLWIAILMIVALTVGAMAEDAPLQRETLKAYRSALEGAPIAVRTYSDAGDVYAESTVDEQLTPFEGQKLTIDRFVLMDLDADGTMELILNEQRDGYDDSCLILDDQDGVVYGYNIGLRGMMALKEDGTFSYSSGASDNGYGTIKLDKAQFQIVPISYCETGADDQIVYYVDGQPAQEGQYQQAVEAQDQKPDAEFITYSQENIDLTLPQ